jgi:uncharacterized DUF497 family protein
MLTKVAGFDWDTGNQEKCRKHGVSLAEIEELFGGTVMMLRDDGHSTPLEERHLAIGKTLEGRYVLVAFTLRQRGPARLIRPISARYMHQKEVDHYEKENPGL